MAATVGNGIIGSDNEEFLRFADEYGAILKDAQIIQQRAEMAARALEPYKEYVE